jgi:3-oxoacyl-[acyl-carrier-protein] synthase II
MASAPTVGVALAGAGMITTLGENAAATWSAMLRGESITDHATVKKQWGGRSRVSGLAIDAAAETVEDAGWSKNDLRSAALVVGTSKGSVIEWLNRGHCGAGIGDLAHEIAEGFDIHGGLRLTVSAACTSGLHALIRGALMIKSGEAQRVLVVAAEASMHELFISSFRRLGVLAKAGAGCRPFDQQRSGFLMSEAGAAVCLEAVESGDDAAGMIVIDRMAMGCDATNMIGGDANGVMLRHLLANVLDGREVDLIHAHGTGTIHNDQIELEAIENSLAAVGGGNPVLYSHKGALGHSLGAAGLVSIVINRLCHSRGIVPPSLAKQPMPTSTLTLSKHPESRYIHRSVAIAAGFGGATSVVSLVNA